MSDITSLTLCELSSKLASKEISSLEATNAYLKQIKQTDNEIGAYLNITEEFAVKSAKSIDEKRSKSQKLSPLAGVPAAIKDNICTKGIVTTCASKMLGDFIPPYNATVMSKLFDNGVVMLGKLNMDEFAMGSTTENSAFKVTHNPSNPEYVPGGSSGGSAACIAANQAAFALGSDTGGSIRQPASFCGVVGMKPTYGAVSRYGLIAFASSLDQIGPLTRNVADTALVLNTICGHDPKDATSADVKYPDYTKALNKDINGFKIAIAKEYFGQGISKEVKDAVLKAAKTYESMGAKISEVSLPSLKYALPAYYVISSAEASSNLARFDGVRYGYRSENYDDIDKLYKNTRSEGFGSEVKRRIMLGTFALSSGYYDAYYKKALQVRMLMLNDFTKIFESNDLILAPVSPTTAYKIGEKSADPLEMYMGDIYTVPINIAGLPAISLPCGKGENNLPIGMQLIGKAYSEQTIISAAHAFEEATK